MKTTQNKNPVVEIKQGQSGQQFIFVPKSSNFKKGDVVALVPVKILETEEALVPLENDPQKN